MVLHYLKKADYLSQSPSLNFEGDSRIKSNFGGILTIIFGCFFVLATVYIGRDLVSRQSPSLVFETRENEENKIMLADYPVALQFKSFYGRDLSNNESFLNSIEIYSEINHLSDEGVESGMFSVKKCDSSFVPKDFIDKINQTSEASQTFCVDFNEATNVLSGEEFKSGKYIKKAFGEADSSFLSILITSCDKKMSSCVEYTHDLGLFYALVMTYDSFTEASNYADPVKKRVNSITGQITKSFYTRQYIQINYNFLITDDGWFFAKDNTEMHYSLGNRTYEIADYLESSRMLYQFTFTAPSQENITKRKYIKVPEIIAFIGGFSKAVLLGLKLILNLYTDYWIKVDTVGAFKPKINTSTNQSQEIIKLESKEIRKVASSKETKKVSHFKQFLKSLIFSSTKLNVEYKQKLHYLDVLTIMRTVEKVQNNNQREQR